MPDESCRQCGGILIDLAQCATCKKIISLICKSCWTKSAEQFHSKCLLGMNQSENCTLSISDSKDIVFA